MEVPRELWGTWFFLAVWCVMGKEVLNAGFSGLL